MLSAVAADAFFRLVDGIPAFPVLPARGATSSGSRAPVKAGPVAKPLVNGWSERSISRSPRGGPDDRDLRTFCTRRAKGAPAPGRMGAVGRARDRLCGLGDRARLRRGGAPGALAGETVRGDRVSPRPAERDRVEDDDQL